VARARATQPKDILARVQDLGEEALHKLAEAPGGARLLEMANQSRTRLDEMQKKLRGLDVLEERVDALEERLDKLTSKPAAKKPAARKPAAKKPSS
jgi:polyhydroxyalkanoate synthesis regulator phasin